ncbi:hypothetical protein ES703_89510 [subsurface metagenome]
MTNPQPTTQRSPERPTGHERKLAEAWGKWLSRFPWDWWWTLTLKPHYRRSEVEVFHPMEIDAQGNLWPESTGVKELKPPLLCPAGVKRARRGLKLFTKHIRRQLPYLHQRLETFTVFQRQPHSRSLHLHGLSYGAGLEDVNRKALEDWCWTHVGKAQIRLYNPALGARFYATQHLFHQDADALDIALSVGLPRLVKSSTEGGSQAQPPLVQAAQVDIGQRLYIDLMRLSA